MIDNEFVVEISISKLSEATSVNPKLNDDDDDDDGVSSSRSSSSSIIGFGENATNASQQLNMGSHSLAHDALIFYSVYPIGLIGEHARG